MIKLVCGNCDHIWYTSNTSKNQKCDECGERLIEVDLFKEIENISAKEFSSKKVTI